MSIAITCLRTPFRGLLACAGLLLLACSFATPALAEGSTLQNIYYASSGGGSTTAYLSKKATNLEGQMDLAIISSAGSQNRYVISSYLAGYSTDSKVYLRQYSAGSWPEVTLTYLNDAVVKSPFFSSNGEYIQLGVYQISIVAGSTTYYLQAPSTAGDVTWTEDASATGTRWGFLWDSQQLKDAVSEGSLPSSQVDLQNRFFVLSMDSLPDVPNVPQASRDGLFLTLDSEPSGGTAAQDNKVVARAFNDILISSNSYDSDKWYTWVLGNRLTLHANASSEVCTFRDDASTQIPAVSSTETYADGDRQVEEDVVYLHSRINTFDQCVVGENFVRTGYAHTGFWSARAGGELIYSLDGSGSADAVSGGAAWAQDGIYRFKEDYDVYAQWSPHKLTVYYHAGRDCADAAHSSTTYSADETLKDPDASTTDDLSYKTVVYYEGLGASLPGANGDVWNLKCAGWKVTGTWHIGSIDGDTVEAGGTYASGQELAEALGASLDDGDATVHLYADWEPFSVLSFDMNGHGEQVDEQKVETGTTPPEPAAPTANGWVFGGWYDDDDFKLEFDFSQPIEGDATVHAKWIPDVWRVSVPTSISYTGMTTGEVSTQTSAPIAVEGYVGTAEGVRVTADPPADMTAQDGAIETIQVASAVVTGEGLTFAVGANAAVSGSSSDTVSLSGMARSLDTWIGKVYYHAQAYGSLDAAHVAIETSSDGVNSAGEEGSPPALEALPQVDGASDDVTAGIGQGLQDGSEEAEKGAWDASSAASDGATTLTYSTEDGMRESFKVTIPTSVSYTGMAVGSVGEASSYEVEVRGAIASGHAVEVSASGAGGLRLDGPDDGDSQVVAALSSEEAVASGDSLVSRYSYAEVYEGTGRTDTVSFSGSTSVAGSWTGAILYTCSLVDA